MHLGPAFSPFGHDLLLETILLVTRETECWTKLFSDSHDFFYFFSTACFFDSISPMSEQVLESTLVVLQRVVFWKRCTLSLLNYM